MIYLVRFFVRLHQLTLSPFLSWISGQPNAGCRFEPTCSRYFLAACETHGILRGSWLGVKRLCRCRPGGGWGADPVPPRANRFPQPAPPHQPSS